MTIGNDDDDDDDDDDDNAFTLQFNLVPSFPDSLFLVFWALIMEIEVIRNFKHILPYNPNPTPTKFYATSLVLQVQNNKLFVSPNH